MMTKTIPVEKFRASLNFTRFIKSKVENELLEGNHVKSQKGGESIVKEVDANFYKDSMNMSRGGVC